MRLTTAPLCCSPLGCWAGGRGFRGYESVARGVGDAWWLAGWLAGSREGVGEGEGGEGLG